MIKCWLRSLAWRLLEKEIGDQYIHRAYFYDYTRWMSRDFPIMVDMQQHFQNGGPFGKVEVAWHREQMAKKYPPSVNCESCHRKYDGSNGNGYMPCSCKPKDNLDNTNLNKSTQGGIKSPPSRP